MCKRRDSKERGPDLDILWISMFDFLPRLSNFEDDYWQSVFRLNTLRSAMEVQGAKWHHAVTLTKPSVKEMSS